MLSSGLASPDGKNALVHLLNYTDYPVDSVTVHVLGQWRRARLYSPDSPARELPVYPVKDGVAVDIPRVTVPASVRFGK